MCPGNRVAPDRASSSQVLFKRGWLKSTPRNTTRGVASFGLSVVDEEGNCNATPFSCLFFCGSPPKWWLAVWPSSKTDKRRTNIYHFFRLGSLPTTFSHWKLHVPQETPERPRRDGSPCVLFVGTLFGDPLKRKTMFVSEQGTLLGVVLQASRFNADRDIL